MKENTIFSISKDNIPVAGCTISGELVKGSDSAAYIFSLAKDTDISPESYDQIKLWKMEWGEADVTFLDQEGAHLREGDLYVCHRNIPIGIKTEIGCIYTEIICRKDTVMNEIVKGGEVFKLKELIPYGDGKIVNMDLVNDKKTKFVLMSFDEGTGLSEHSAPGNAIVFALEGNGIIGCRGKEYPIQAGENFKFDKGDPHYVKADGKFKMALLLVMEQ